MSKVSWLWPHCCRKGAQRPDVQFTNWLWPSCCRKGAERPDLQQCKLPVKEGSTVTWHTIYKLTVAFLLYEESRATWLTTVQITSEGREHSDLTYNLQTDCGLTVVGREQSDLTYNSANYQWRKGAQRPDVQYFSLCRRPLLEGSKATW